jgi:molybdopterin molybdotransferase
MISLAEARALIAETISPLPAVALPLTWAGGRVLRQDVKAREDVPGFDRSAMDGYAIASWDTSEKFRIVAEIQPGAVPKCKIGRGDCARIFTGAPIPAGASQVMMQEDVRVEGGFMVPVERSRALHVRYRGEDARKGDLLLKSGTPLGAGELALLASLGLARLKISPGVRIAHFATGDELVAPDKKLKPGQIRDSNSTLVAALVRQFGGEMVKQARVADDFDLLLKKMRALKKSFDLLLLSGGASVGDYDFGKKLLTALGFKIHFTAIHLRPGKPLVFATRGRQAAFVVPGNPVSHLVTLHVAVRLAFERFAGANTSWPLVRIKLAEAFGFKPASRETFWPARMEVNNGELVARALRWQSSGDVTGLIGVNALLQLGANAEAPRAGEEISVLMLDVP